MITIEIVDESGQLLERFDDPLVAHVLQAAAPDSSVCLRFIDSYGDAVFNTLQIPVLLEEIRTTAAGLSDHPRLTQLRRLSEFVEGAITRQPHVYLKFVGD